MIRPFPSLCFGKKGFARGGNGQVGALSNPQREFFQKCSAQCRVFLQAASPLIRRQFTEYIGQFFHLQRKCFSRQRLVGSDRFVGRIPENGCALRRDERRWDFRNFILEIDNGRAEGRPRIVQNRIRKEGAASSGRREKRKRNQPAKAKPTEQIDHINIRERLIALHLRNRKRNHGLERRI